MRWCFVLALAIAVLPFGSVAGDEHELRKGETVTETEAAFPGAVPLDADGIETVWCVRIVDAIDRRPVPGARVSVPYHPRWLTEEDQHHQCVSTAGWDGWVRLPWAGVRGWRDYVFADAPGYAADEYCQPGSNECALRRGTDVPIVLLDYTGRPVPNAQVALNLGCGHVPDQRGVMTDARGRAVLRDILASRHRDIWIKAAHCHRGTTRLRRTWRTGDPPVGIDAIPGMTTSGRILLPDGTPAMHVEVGARDLDRPVTSTDREGRFQLVGVSAWSEIEFFPPPDLGFEDGVFIVPPEGVERVLTLGEQASGATVNVTCLGPKGEPAEGVRVAVVRARDGFTICERCDDGGRATLEVGAGRYRVLADGELGRWGSCETTLTVPSSGATALKVVVPRNPTVRVDASRVADLRVGLTTRRGFRVLKWNEEDEDIDKTDVPVPKDERAFFRISGDVDRELVVSYVEVPPPGGSVTLDWVPVKRVTARLVGPGGKAALGVLTLTREHRLEWDRWYEDMDETSSEPFAETRLIGTVTWVATPSDPALAQRFGHVRLPTEGGTVALGEIRLAPSGVPDLHIDLPPDLLEAGGATLTCSVPGAGGEVVSEILADGTLDPEDAEGWPTLGPGAPITVRFKDYSVLPVRYRLSGAPPWRISLPKSTLKLVVGGPGDGKPLEDAVVIFDGQLLGAAYRDGKPIEIRGVTAGSHTVIIAERRHVGKEYRLVIKKDETRVLRLRLNARSE